MLKRLGKGIKLEIVRLLKFALVLSCILIHITATSQEYIDVELSFQSTFPELYGFAYRNVAFNLEYDFYERPYGGLYQYGGWIIKRIDPLPEAFPDVDTCWCSRLDTFACYYDSSAGMWRHIFQGEISFLFGLAGTNIFRNGYGWDIPYWPFPPGEYWNWLEGENGIYGEDEAHFDFGVPDAKFHFTVLCPKDWLPVIEGYIDTTGQPNYEDFKVTLKAIFTSRRAEQMYKIRWVLQNISWYTQAAMNYPNVTFPEGPPSAPDPFNADLKLLNEYNENLPIPLSCSWDSTRRAFYGETESPVATGDTVQAVVTCYDFGAHGDILMEAYSEESTMWYILSKHVEEDSQCVSFATIPVDEDGPTKDKLADHWEELMLLHANCPDTIDSIAQITPVQDFDWYIDGVLPCELGDYLNTFEEYRGFYCRGIHTRTCPWEKDFFIYSNLDSMSLNTGIGWADSIGPGLGHWIDESEMKHYEEPNPHGFLPIWARSVNWYNDRIESSDTCACAILLKNTDWDSSSIRYPIGATWHLDSTLNYKIPRTAVVSYIYTNRIRAHTPPNRNDTVNVDLPQDSLCQLHVAGHEIGHIVNMGHNPDSSSIMFEYLIDFLHPAWEYKQADLDSFLVKPIQ